MDGQTMLKNQIKTLANRKSLDLEIQLVIFKIKKMKLDGARADGKAFGVDTGILLLRQSVSRIGKRQQVKSVFEKCIHFVERAV